MGVCASESAPLLILFSFWQAHSSAVNGVVWVESEAGKSAIIAGACVLAGLVRCGGPVQHPHWSALYRISFHKRAGTSDICNAHVCRGHLLALAPSLFHDPG